MNPHLVSTRERALLNLKRCPCCGANQVATTSGRVAAVGFACSSRFLLDANAEIIPADTCPTGSYIAARALNAEALKAAAEMAGAA
jgi:hypothetical protein